jgi:hypothetical protein
MCIERTILSCVLLSAAGMWSCGQGAVESRSSRSSAYQVRVFGCLIEIPQEYVLNTSEVGSFYFVSSSLKKSTGSIRISSEEPDISGLQERGGTATQGQEVQIGRFRVRKYTVSSEPVEAGGRLMNLAIVDDGRSYLTIIGDESERAASMVSRCVDQEPAR